MTLHDFAEIFGYSLSHVTKTARRMGIRGNTLDDEQADKLQDMVEKTDHRNFENFKEEWYRYVGNE